MPASSRSELSARLQFEQYDSRVRGDVAPSPYGGFLEAPPPPGGSKQLSMMALPAAPLRNRCRRSRARRPFLQASEAAGRRVLDVQVSRIMPPVIDTNDELVEVPIDSAERSSSH